MKKISIVILSLFICFNLNLCYYVFYGQTKSITKLNNKEDLNLYECCSIYSIHLAICSYGLFFSPEGAYQQFLMSFPHKDTVVFNNRYVRNCKQTVWKNYTFENIRLSAALNGTYFKNNIRYGYMSYPDLRNVTKIKSIPVVCEGLIHYLQQKGWIFTYHFKYI